jgi:predicted TIM-barrel fold metal-dependent hydrolase
MTLSLENPLFRRELAIDRKAQAGEQAGALEDLTVVSSDGHWEIAEDIFYENFPAHLKDKAPRVWFDGGWKQGFPEQDTASPENMAMAATLRDLAPKIVGGEGVANIEVRRRDLDIEGVHKELLYPQGLLGFLRLPDLEVQENIYWAYNEYIARVASAYPNQFYGVGVCSNWWDPSKARRSIQQITDLGLKTFLLPTSNAGKTLDGKVISYASAEMEPLWTEIEDAGIPVSFHIGENITFQERGAFGATAFQSFTAARKPLGELMFGGVFDRHPDLKVVFVEFGLAWIPVALQEAEQLIDQQGPILDAPLQSMPKRRPTEYWRNNCYATFQNDRLGLKLLDYIGADRVMWAQDYPHNESTFGYSWDSRQAVIDATSASDARKILGETAVRLYGL